MRQHDARLSAPVLLGRTRTGSPVWSQAGGSTDVIDDVDVDDTDDVADDLADDDVSGDDDVDDEPLGPAGEKALAAMKKRARDAEREIRKLKAAQTPDVDATDPDELRKQIRDELVAETARDRALDKLEARAARKFHNPDLARKLLADQAEDFLDETGKPDLEAINEALDELLENEPYLALTAQRGKRFEGKADGGARKGPKAGQLTRADLDRMSPEEITKAQTEGRFDQLLGKTS